MVQRQYLYSLLALRLRIGKFNALSLAALARTESGDRLHRKIGKLSRNDTCNEWNSLHVPEPVKQPTLGEELARDSQECFFSAGSESDLPP